MTVDRGEEASPGLRPATVCGELLRALEATDGRRKRRQRDTTPDTLGIALKRELLAAAVREDPEPATFEAWLLERCLERGETVSVGAARAMAIDIASDWRLASQSPAFREWLARGAPSDDARDDGG